MNRQNRRHQRNALRMKSLRFGCLVFALSAYSLGQEPRGAIVASLPSAPVAQTSTPPNTPASSQMMPPATPTQGPSAVPTVLSCTWEGSNVAASKLGPEVR